MPASSSPQGCAEQASPREAGAIARALRDAANESGVPRDLLVAIAAEEGGLRLSPHRSFVPDDHVPVAGYLELRHGRYDSLRRAAELAGVSEQELVEDSVLATRAGALVLAELGRASSVTSEDLLSWEPALRTFSGMSGSLQQDYASRVLGHLVAGERVQAYAGEIVELPAHRQLRLLGVAIQALNGTPDYPSAIWIETSCADKCNIGRGGTVVDTIVIHDTEGDWNASVATLQNDAGKSVHYIVDADGGRVAQFRPETDITWHTGNTVYNGRSIGIEHVGFVASPSGFSAALYATSAALVADIRTRNTVPLDRAHIIGHYQVPDGAQIGSSAAPCADPILTCLGSSKYGGANNHRDPGSKWQWCQYMQRLGGSCTCNDAFSHFNCTTDKTQAVRCSGGSVEIRSCQDPCIVEAIGVDDTCVPTVDDLGVTDAATDPNAIDMSGNEPPEDQGCSCDMSARPRPKPIGLLALVVLLLLRRRASS